MVDDPIGIQNQDGSLNNSLNNLDASLSGQTALVTGAGRGIGRAIAIAMAQAGARVACVSRTQSEVDDVALFINSTLHSEAKSFPWDISDIDSVPDLIKQINHWVERPIDIIVNCAGVARIEAIECGLDMEIWQKVIATNLMAPVALINQVVPGMLSRGNGCIISIGTRNAVCDMPFTSSYSVSKTGLLKFHHTLECEVEGRGLYNYYLQPGNIATTILSAPNAVDSNSFEHVNGVCQMIQRVSNTKKGSPAVTAQVCVMLAAGLAKELSGRYIDLQQGLEGILNTLCTYTGNDAQKDELFKLTVKN
ncbi:NAD(P)-binding protein [Penicillium herquei]|nr:NAD(P)-binding protein [Penicillium herquei]